MYQASADWGGGWGQSSKREGGTQGRMLGKTKERRCKATCCLAMAWTTATESCSSPERWLQTSNFMEMLICLWPALWSPAHIFQANLHERFEYQRQTNLWFYSLILEFSISRSRCGWFSFLTNTDCLLNQELNCLHTLNLQLGNYPSDGERAMPFFGLPLARWWI